KGSRPTKGKGEANGKPWRLPITWGRPFKAWEKSRKIFWSSTAPPSGFQICCVEWAETPSALRKFFWSSRNFSKFFPLLKERQGWFPTKWDWASCPKVSWAGNSGTCRAHSTKGPRHLPDKLSS